MFKPFLDFITVLLDNASDLLGLIQAMRQIDANADLQQLIVELNEMAAAQPPTV